HQVARAFRALGDHDAVFGPATDGGFWLVGMKRTRALPPDLFKGVRWSTEDTLTHCIAGLMGVRIALIETLADIDRAADLERKPGASPRTPGVFRPRKTGNALLGWRGVPRRAK
ncbi:hypothetical protein CGU37_28960, partial [Pseudomonas fluorescens]